MQEDRYRPILTDRRQDDELTEARRILHHWLEKFTSGNENPVRERSIVGDDVDVLDTRAFFERWPPQSKHEVAPR